ncbi:MAG: putative F420-dependent oxidoreductase [Candidatus Poriferisodalaceae bacterium]|jgi:probable F420-dependent oxidoreductase
MDWGVHLPHLGRTVSRESLIEFSQEVDRLGFTDGWTSDHVCWPADVESKYPYTDDGSFPATPDMGWLDPLGTLQFVAACTENLRLGITVLILPYRLPVVTAKQLATIDVLSNGRLILGVGVGWMQEEAEVLGMPWDQRGRRSDEQLEIFETLFKDETPSYDGDFYQFPEVGFFPKPVQDPVPVWVGGASKAAFKRTARFGHGFHAAFQPLDVVKDEWAAIQDECDAIGRDRDEITLSLRVYLDPGSAMEPKKSVGGSVEQMLDTIGQMQEAGIQHILLDPVARGGVPGRLDSLRAFMADVASQVD